MEGLSQSMYLAFGSRSAQVPNQRSASAPVAKFSPLIQTRSIVPSYLPAAFSLTSLFTASAVSVSGTRFSLMLYSFFRRGVT